MVAYSGALVLLKLYTEEGHFSTVGGMRTTRFVLNNQLIDATHKESGPWRELLAEAGLRSVSISGNGIFTDKASEACVRADAFGCKLRRYQLCFGNGDILSGHFLVTVYERSGVMQEEEAYSIALESSGAVDYKTAA